MTAVPDATAVSTFLAERGAVYAQTQIETALAVEVVAQRAACRVESYNDSLAGALLRRVHRHLAMLGSPLGVQQGEYGGTRIGSVDPEVRRLEAPFRRAVCG